MQINADDLEIIKQARAAKKNAEAVGINVTAEPTYAVNTQAYDNFIPIENTPSLGIGYPSELRGQPLKVEDLLLIQSITDKTFFKRFTELMERRFRGVEPGNILVSDELYLALWLRANSYPGYLFPGDAYKCSHCDYDVPSHVVEFKFSDMNFSCSNINEVKEKFKGKDSTTLTLTSGKDVVMQMKRRKHQGRIESVLQRDYYQYGTTPDDVTYQLMNIASNIKFDGDSDIMDTVENLKALTPIEFVELLRLMKKFTLTGDPVIDVVCPACGEVNQIFGYIFRPDIYLPIDN